MRTKGEVLLINQPPGSAQESTKSSVIHVLALISMQMGKSRVAKFGVIYPILDVVMISSSLMRVVVQ